MRSRMNRVEEQARQEGEGDQEEHEGWRPAGKGGTKIDENGESPDEEQRQCAV
jgi:hypothetical protein